MINLREKIVEYRRVLNATRRPTKEEYTASAKITSIGMVIMGLLGFSVFMIFILAGI